MEKKEGLSRREFLGKSTVGALAFPVILNGCSKAIAADEAPSQGIRKSNIAKVKKIAIEEHWGTREIMELGERWRRKTGGRVMTSPKGASAIPESLTRLWDFEEHRLPLMDEYGITMQVLALSSPGIQAYTFAEASAAINMSKKINDAQAEIIHKHPGRFAGFAALPTQDPKAAADELERTVTELGFKGAMIQGHTNWEYLDADKYRVLWERVAALEAPIYLHISEPSSDTKKAYSGRPELLGTTWAVGVETATHALRIIASGVFDVYPKATLILGHLGESLPYLLGRMDEAYVKSTTPPENRKLKKMFSQYVKENLLVTTSGLYKPEALICAINAMGPDRVLFAVDYPFLDPKLSVPLFDSTPMSDEVREKICHLNAEKWLKLS
jgi:2,3-dihydroxybenzoate decarboxylase